MTDSVVNEFIDDYFAECDEHLATIRRILLVWEERAGTAPRASEMSEMARALHTIKGLSGMVGFGDAEKVAHLLEDWLRAATQTDQHIAGDTLDGLFAGTRLLESCIAAHRAGTASPDIEVFTARVTRRSGPAATASTHSGDDAHAAGHALAAGDIYDCEFSPSPERAARGVTVESVRTQLAAIGTIIKATPRMAEGRVAFHFLVALSPDKAPPESNDADGLACTFHNVAPIAAQPAAPEQSAGQSLVRVSLSRLDDLMRLVGELVITRGRVEAGIDALDQRNPEVVALQDANYALERQLRDLSEAIRRVRMVALSEVFERMRYAAREAAREAGKQVVVVMSGEDTEVDKMIVERMLEPLLHLVRNAVGHGMETPATRIAQGKQAAGTLSLRARTAGERIVIDVEDDGAGLDYERIARRARAAGILPGDTPADASNVLDILAAPGFSTHEEVDMTSGRGVGMAVVRQRVQELGGQLTVTTRTGGGTRFTIRLPLTLMIVDAVMFDLGGNRMAAPQPGIVEVVQVERDRITSFQNNEVIAYRDGFLPLLHLRAMFNMPAAAAPREMLHALVINTAEEPIGIIVDRIVGQREIVVAALADPLVAVPGISGATAMSDGSVALIIDTAALAQRALRLTTTDLQAGP